MFIEMKEHVTQRNSLMCFNSFWQQWSSAAQRNKLHQALLVNRINSLLVLVVSWDLSLKK